MDVEVRIGSDSELVRLNSSVQHLAVIVQELKFLGYSVAGKRVDYWSYLIGSFVKCGIEPLPVSVVVPAFEMKEKLVLRFEPADWTDGSSLPSALIAESETYQRYPEIQPDESLSDQKKERIIGHVLERVTKWRDIVRESKHKRETDPDCPEERQTLEEAAIAVGVAKKSLDDYLLMIRFGKKFGFNFEAHRDERVGVLRSYVKAHKEIMRLLQASTDSFLREPPQATRLPRHVAQLIRKVTTRCTCCRPPGCDYASLLKYEENK